MASDQFIFSPAKQPSSRRVGKPNCTVMVHEEPAVGHAPHDYAQPGRPRSARPPTPAPRPLSRILLSLVWCAGLESSASGTHSMRRTKAAQIDQKTGNLRAVQLLLGHTKLEITVRYLGIEVDDALSISEQVEL